MMRNIFITSIFCVIQLYGIGQTTFNVNGVITDEGLQPLSGAIVMVHETYHSAITNKDGYYEIVGLKAGSYHLHVRYLGYEAESKPISISDKNIEVYFALKKSSLEMKEFVVESDHMKGSTEQHSQTVEIANDKFLQQNQTANLSRTIAKLPGLDVISVGTGVGKPVIRGLSANRIAVSENGIIQEGQQWGSDHGLEIDANNVGRVEVIKGPAALVYGAGAIGGVIIVSPPDPPDQNSISAGISGVGQLNTQMLGGSGYLGLNKNGFFVRGRYSHKEFGDIMVPLDSFNYEGFTMPLIKNRIKNTAGNESSMYVNAGVTKAWGVSQLTYTQVKQGVGFFPGAFGTPTLEKLADDGNIRNLDAPLQEVTHNKLISNNNILFNKNWLEIDVGYQENLRKEKENEDGVTIDALIMKLKTLSGSAHYHDTKSEGLTMNYGLTGLYKQNRIGGEEYLIPNFDQFQFGALAYMEINREKRSFNFGLRYDFGNIKTQEFKEGGVTKVAAINRDFHNLSGAVGASFYSSHHYNLKINLGSSFRYPTAAELASDGEHDGAFRFEKGDANLLPERGYQLDLNWSYHQSNFLAKVTPYFNYFENFIYLAPSGRVALSENEGGKEYTYQQSNALHTGAEFVMDYHLMEHIHTELIAQYVFAQNLNTGKSIPLISPGSVGLDLSYEIDTMLTRIQNGYLSLQPIYVFAQNMVAIEELATPSYFLLDLTIGFDVELSKKQLIKVSFQVRNVLDVTYYNHLSRFRLLGISEPARNFIVSISIPILNKSL